MNNNIYQLDSDIEKDSIVVTGFSGEVECAAGARNSYTISLGREMNRFKKFRTENFVDTDFEFEYRANDLVGDWLTLSADADRTESKDDALVELHSRNNTYRISVADSLGAKTTGEIYFEREREAYKTLESSNSTTNSVGAVYTYDLGGFSYVEVSCVQENAKYPNTFLIDSNYNDTSTSRGDRTMSFSVTVFKTFSIYPFEFLQVGGETNRNTSNSNTAYEWFDSVTYEPYFKIVGGYDDYDDDNFFIYYLRGINEKTTLYLYYMYDRTTYNNVYIFRSYYEEPSIPMTNTMHYYLAGLQFALSDGWSLDISATEIRNSSNDAAYNYTQKIYSAGLTLSR